MNQKTTIQDQIERFKSKNVQFDVVNEKQATEYLKYHNYYFKLKSYCKSFEWNQKKQQYLHCDFAYLVELAELDSILKEYILDLAIDTEHFLKVKLIRDVTENEGEDGYTIVEELFKKYPYIPTKIEKMKYDSASADLIHKYENNWAVWNLVEVLSFGDLIKLFKLYYENFPSKNSKTINNLLWSVRFLRNAAAHNNCLLNSLRRPYIHTHLLDDKSMKIKMNKELLSFLSKIPNISKESKSIRLKNPIIHDFIASLYLYTEVCSVEKLKSDKVKQIYQLLGERMILHKEYFVHDDIIFSNYVFVKKVVEYLYENSV